MTLPGRIRSPFQVDPDPIVNGVKNRLFAAKDSGFAVRHMQEATGHQPTNDLVSGEWNHFTAVIPPWLSFLARLDERKDL